MADKFSFTISCNSLDIKKNPLLVPIFLCFAGCIIWVILVAPSMYKYGFLFSFIGVILFIYYNKNLKKNLKKGTLIFYDNRMEISEKESKNIIDYSDITDICIHFIAKKGDVFGPRGLPALGNDNKIIITKNGTKITNRILCESLADYYRLKLLGKYLQEKKMSVKMKGFSK